MKVILPALTILCTAINIAGCRHSSINHDLYSDLAHATRIAVVSKYKSTFGDTIYISRDTGDVKNFAKMFAPTNLDTDTTPRAGSLRSVDGEILLYQADGSVSVVNYSHRLGYEFRVQGKDTVRPLTQWLDIFLFEQEQKYVDERNSRATGQPKLEYQLPFTDTIIKLSNISYPTQKIASKLSMTKAKKSLYDYYRAKGFAIETQPENNFGDISCIIFDTIYPISLNNDTYEDAIVQYLEMPCMGSSVCYIPKYGMLMNRSKGYTLVNDNFLTEGQGIDSLYWNEDKHLIICTTVFSCGNHVDLEIMRYTIKSITSAAHH